LRIYLISGFDCFSVLPPFETSLFKNNTISPKKKKAPWSHQTPKEYLLSVHHTVTGNRKNAKGPNHLAETGMMLRIRMLIRQPLRHTWDFYAENRKNPSGFRAFSPSFILIAEEHI